MARYRLYAGAVIAAVIGLLVLPAVFHALSAHDVEIANRFSMLAVIWFVLGLIISGYLLTTRGTILGKADHAIRVRFSPLNALAANSPGSSAATDYPAAASGTVIRVADLIYLLIIQAILREPFVAVAKSFAPEAIIDGAYVGLVFLIAVALLVGMRTGSRPLLDRLLWLGLDQIVPTAGYDTAKTDVSSPRTTPPYQIVSGPGHESGTAQKAGKSDKPDFVASAESPTIMAPGDAATVLEEPAIVAEATVAAVRAGALGGLPSEVSGNGGETIVAEAKSSERPTRIADAPPASDETIAPTGVNRRGPNEGEH